MHLSDHFQTSPTCVNDFTRTLQDVELQALDVQADPIRNACPSSAHRVHGDDVNHHGGPFSICNDLVAIWLRLELLQKAASDIRSNGSASRLDARIAKVVHEYMSVQDLKRCWRGFERQYSTEWSGPPRGHDGIRPEKCPDVEYGFSRLHGRLEISKKSRLILMWHVTPDVWID